MIHLVKFNGMWLFSKFPVIKVLSHDMQINNIHKHINLTHIEKIPNHSWDP